MGTIITQALFIGTTAGSDNCDVADAPPGHRRGTAGKSWVLLATRAEKRPRKLCATARRTAAAASSKSVILAIEQRSAGVPRASPA